MFYSEIAVANCPDKKIALAAASAVPEAVSKLSSLGIDVIAPEPDYSLPEEIRNHTDMLMCHCGHRTVVYSPSQEKLADRLREYGFCCISSEIAPAEKYPADCVLNVAVSRSFAVGYKDNISRVLSDNLSEKHFINVRQGYSKCSVCFITPDAVITEDAGIAVALKEYGTDVLKISAGDVFLSDIHYGFLGGACGLIDRNLLAVNGELEYHSDYENISAFLKKYDVEYVALRRGKIHDIGGIIPLMTY